MYNKIIFCLIAITAVTIVQTKTNEWWNSEVALQLDNTNFDESIRTNQYIVVNFYNKYSVESKNIAPEFEKLAENYMGPDRKRTDVVVATVDGWAYETISAAHDVHTFPEILLFSQKGLITYIYYNEYIGERMIEWVESILSVEGNENDAPLEQPLKPETYSEQMNYTSEDLGDITNDLIDPANSDIDVYYEFQDTQGKINDEIGVVLDSTLPEPRVIEVVNKATSITPDLESAINDNLHKIGELMEAIASQNSDPNGLNGYLKDVDQMLQHLEEEMHSAKAQADSSQPGPTRRYLEEVKVTLDEVQTQISEHNNEGKSSWTSILFAVGLLGGAVLAYVGLKSDNKKKVRKSVYD